MTYLRTDVVFKGDPQKPISVLHAQFGAYANASADVVAAPESQMRVQGAGVNDLVVVAGAHAERVDQGYQTARVAAAGLDADAVLNESNRNNPPGQTIEDYGRILVFNSGQLPGVSSSLSELHSEIDQLKGLQTKGLAELQNQAKTLEPELLPWAEIDNHSVHLRDIAGGASAAAGASTAALTARLADLERQTADLLAQLTTGAATGPVGPAGVDGAAGPAGPPGPPGRSIILIY